MQIKSYGAYVDVEPLAPRNSCRFALAVVLEHLKCNLASIYKQQFYMYEPRNTMLGVLHLIGPAYLNLG